MKTKIIIPRKEHEVYFIPAPEGLKSNTARRFILDKLNELHPDFSAAARVDIKSFNFNETRWFMATVIAGETLAEYQLIHRGAVFYTNTSILAHSRGFTSNNPEKIDDELIGFDAEKNMPVSIPLEEAGGSAGQRFIEELSRIPLSRGVFHNKKPKWLTAAIPAGVTALILAAATYTSAGASGDKSISSANESSMEQTSIMPAMPDAFSILENTAELLLQANGEIDRWQFNENAVPSIFIQCRGVSALTAHTIFSKLEYITLDDIQVVNYNNNNPVVNISLTEKQDAYSLPVSTVFPRQSAVLSAASELTGLFRSQYINIISETLPSVDNGYEFYTINYTANDKNLIYSIKTINELCEKHSFLVKRLDISTGADKNIFTAACALSCSAAVNNTNVIQNDKIFLIPLAFGYKQPVRDFTFPVMTESTTETASVIGTIRDADGQIIYFHDSKGKINIRSGR